MDSNKIQARTEGSLNKQYDSDVDGVLDVSNMSDSG